MPPTIPQKRLARVVGLAAVLAALSGGEASESKALGAAGRVTSLEGC